MKSCSVLFLAAMGGLSLTYEASAAVYPGMMCKAVGSDQGVLSYDSDGRVFNRGTREVEVICPIVRESSDKKWTSLAVVVADRSASANVVCDAVSAQIDGAGWFEQKASSGYQPEWYQSQTLTFGPPKEERHDGSFYLRCKIPPLHQGNASGILTYRISEATMECGTTTGYTTASGGGPGTSAHSHGYSFTYCY